MNLSFPSLLYVTIQNAPILLRNQNMWASHPIHSFPSEASLSKAILYLGYILKML